MGDKRQLIKAAETVLISKFKTGDFLTGDKRRPEGQYKVTMRMHYPNDDNLWI